ncbi:MAG: HAMP domain-containing histidine kinase [Methanobacteriota archaeon]|nr:MAG: HAMP domain-containing histidine kinase [Euryarchaeota archaeon]
MQQSTYGEKGTANSLRQSVTNLPEDLSSVLKLIVRAESLDMVLDRIAHAIALNFDIKSLTICLYDDESGFFIPTQIYGFPEDQTKAIAKHAYTLERKKDDLDEKFRISRDCYYIKAEQITKLHDDDIDYLNGVPKKADDAEPGDWHELDYVNLLMRDRLGNIIGWIEINEPLHHQELSLETIESIRLFSDLAAIAVETSKMSGEAIAAVNESQSQIYLIVHDIGDLMEPLVQHLDSARKDQDSEDAISLNLDKALAIARQVKTLTRNVRRFTEARRDDRAERQLYDLRQVLVRCVSTIKADFPEKQVAIEFDFPPDKCMIIADDLIADLFSDLLGSAVKYCADIEAEIDVTISSNHDSWIIRIDDHGMGLTDKMKNAASSRFPQKPGDENGGDLELPVVSLLVNRYHGLVTVKDGVAADHTKGSSVEIALPKARDT